MTHVMADAPMRGFPASAACVLCVVLGTVTACSTPPPLPIGVNAAWATRSINHEASLQVPADWNAGEAWTQPSSFTDLMASYSNQSLSPPCTTGPTTIECGPPLATLEPGAVLVEVWHNSAPGWDLSSYPGTPTVVSGLPARTTDQSGAHGSCGGMAADHSRSVVIPFPSTPDNWIEFDICSHGVTDVVGARIMESVAVALPTT
jgi:hypothetical protein